MKYLMILKGDDRNEYVVLIFGSKEARKEATLKAVFGDIEPPNDYLNGEDEKILDCLEENGEIHFEGDPGIIWINARHLEIIP